MHIEYNRTLPGTVALLLAILFIGISVLSGCYGQGQPRGWSGATVSDDSLFTGSLDGRLVGLHKSDGSPLWQDEDAGMLGTSDSKVAIYGTPAAGGELVYVAGYNGKVYAFLASTGALRWVYPREGNLEGPIVSGVVVSQGRAYFGDAKGVVYALDMVTGDKLWSFETQDKVWSTPAINGDTLYVTSFDKKLYALNTSDGRQKWQFEADGVSVSTLLIYENTVYFGTFDRRVYAVNAATGSLKWRSEVEGGKWFWAEPVAYNNVIYAPNLDGKVYILNAENGSEVASAVNLGSPISSSPVLAGNKVIIATEEGTVYSLDTTSHQTLIVDVREATEKAPKNTDRKIYAPLSAANSVVYIKAQTSSEDALYAVNVETEQILWSQSLIISETSEGD